jgi:hypothetical protein
MASFSSEQERRIRELRLKEQRDRAPGLRSIASLTGYIPLPLVPSERSPGTRTPSPGRGPSLEDLEREFVSSILDPDRPMEQPPPIRSTKNPAPQSSMQLDPVEVRNRQNMLLAQQRGVDQQIRALRRKRVQSGELSPQEIQQLTQLEQQAVQLRQGKVDAFRLGNELQGRGPLSADEAEASRQRLGLQVAEARRRVMGQAEGELDSRFDAQVQREQAGIPDYRPAGMGDRREVQLREEMAVPSPEMAQRQFMEATAGGGMTDDQRSKREARMQTVRQAEMERQARMRRDQGVTGMEADAALDARETRAQIPNMEAENDVARTRNAGQAAEVESQALDQQYERLSQLGPLELEVDIADAQRRRQELQMQLQTMQDQNDPQYIALVRESRMLEAEMENMQIAAANRKMREEIRRMESPPEQGGYNFTSADERMQYADSWLGIIEGGGEDGMPGIANRSLHGRAGSDAVGLLRTYREKLDEVEPNQRAEAAAAVTQRLGEVFTRVDDGGILLNGAPRRGLFRGAYVDKDSVNNWNLASTEIAKVMQAGGQQKPFVVVLHANNEVRATGANGKSVKVGPGVIDPADIRKKIYGGA